MVDINEMDVKRAFVSLAIEKALWDIGKATFETVGKKLYSRYKAYFADCYDHPEYLNAVLKELYGQSYHMIVDAIRKELGEIASQKPVEEFLVKINQ